MSKEIYDWIHEERAPQIAEMCLGEVLINYLYRRHYGVDSVNNGPSNLMNILISDRLSQLGVQQSDLDKMSDQEVRNLAYENIT